MIFFDQEAFIATHITGRTESLFKADLINNQENLQPELDHKNVLVIGGAGTIGTHFIKSLLRFHPQSLTVVDISENGLAELVRDLRSSVGINIPGDFKTYPLSFGNKIFYKVCTENGPFDIIANFSAHKHVRSEKDVLSVKAMIENNILYNHHLLHAFKLNPPAHLFCVSTDKATNPANLMGATKKYMEQILLAYGNFMKVSTARFANVAFSQGSLLAGFLERISKNQPVSAPSDIRRYFISPEEAGHLCLLACVLSKSKDIFFPKLNPESMKSFSEISDRLINWLGMRPAQCVSEGEAREIAHNRNIGSGDYPVYYFESDTTGEKLFEEFYSNFETVDLHSFQSMGIIKNSSVPSIGLIEQQMEELQNLLNSDSASKTDIINFFRRHLPLFDHIETGHYLDEKM